MSYQNKGKEKSGITYAILPEPAKLQPKPGQCRLSEAFQISCPGGEPEWEQLGHYLAALLRPATGFAWPVNEQGIPGKTIALIADASIVNPEAYRLHVAPGGIRICAGHPAGAFYAIQSLRQLLPPELEPGELRPGISWAVPCVEIEDAPRFPYRGMHLDVSRHFFPPEFIKRYIGLLAMHKMNHFHWHLTDDQGWRIEIKGYPKLQEIAAYRKETLEGHYSSQPRRYDGRPYGGYYTQEEVKDIVAYAQSRFVTIIPEIEMPGHCLAALAAYPGLSCTGGPFETATHWGIFEEPFCTREATFQFLENVLSEVAGLFPGRFIHIGGDECPKQRWKNCTHCQQRIRDEGLKGEHELQSYFIRRIEQFLHSKGRGIIGWDEILEGGLAPRATVMSWRGAEGGIAAARQGHGVIMAPTSTCYFDYYQSMSDEEPLAIGGYLPLENVYGYEPVPRELSPEESQRILGVQGNLWTEYIPDARQAEYMAYPRAIALAEVGWSPKEKRDFDSFARRLMHHSRRLDELGVEYSRQAFGVRIAAVPAEGGGVEIRLSTLKEETSIRYTIDGQEPDSHSPEYSGPVKLMRDGVLMAAVFEGGARASSIIRQEVSVHRAVGRPIRLKHPPHSDYRHLPASVLVNGLPASETRFKDGEWLAWQEAPMEASIDLGILQPIESVGLHFFNDPGVWIYPPSAASLSFSDDGAIFRAPENMEERIEAGAQGRTQHRTFRPASIRARYIRIIAEPHGIIPRGAPGSGHHAWLLVGEIVVR